MSADYVWFPDDDIKRNSNWAKFLRASNVGTYEELARRADAEPEWFWDALIRHSGFRFKKPYSQVLDLSEGLPFAKWCIGATTNYTLSCLERNIEEGRGAKTFLVWQGEDGQERTWTYDGLVRETDRIVAALKMLDIGRGDVVGLYMPLMPEAASAVLAVARIGGIIMPLFSGFGADAISTRLNDGEAKAVITVDGCYRRGRRIAMKPIMDEALTKVPSVKSVLVISRFGETPELVPGRDHSSRRPRERTHHPRPWLRSCPPILHVCSSTRPAPPANRKEQCTRTSACRSRSSRTSSSASI